MFYGFSFFDIGAVFILLVSAIIGIKKGMLKMVFGMLSSLGALALAIFLVIPTTNFVVEVTPVDDIMVNAIHSRLASRFPILDSQLGYYDIDGDPETPEELAFLYDGTIIPLDDVLAQSTLTNYFSDQIIEVVAEHLPTNNTSFLSTATSLLVAYALIPICFIFLWIFSAIAFSILSGILTTLTSRLTVISFVDKVAGLILSCIIALVVIVGVLTVIDLASGVEIVNSIKTNFIDSSMIGGFINQINPFPDMIRAIDFTAIINNLLDKIGLNI